MNKDDQRDLYQELVLLSEHMKAAANTLELMGGKELVHSTLQERMSYQVAENIRRAFHGKNSAVIKDVAEAVRTARTEIADVRARISTIPDNIDAPMKRWALETNTFYNSTLGNWRDKYSINVKTSKPPNGEISMPPQHDINLTIPIWQAQKMAKMYPQFIYRWRPLTKTAERYTSVTHRSIPTLRNPFSAKELDKGVFIVDASFYKKQDAYNLFSAVAIKPRGQAYNDNLEMIEGIIAATANNEFTVAAFKEQPQSEYTHIVARDAVKLCQRRVSDYVNRRLMDEPMHRMFTDE